MYGHIASSTGWTFREIDELLWFEIEDLLRYWKQQPPTHVLVAAYLGAGEKKHTEAEMIAELEEMGIPLSLDPLPACYRVEN